MPACTWLSNIGELCWPCHHPDGSAADRALPSHITPLNDPRPVQHGGWVRLGVPAAPAISFPSSRNVTPCHHLPRTKTYRSTH